jgi:HEAT repeat protein
VSRMLIGPAAVLPLVMVPSFAIAQPPAAAATSLPRPFADLQHEDDKIRAAAIKSLGEMNADKRDVLPALADAAKDPVWFVRVAAARALGKMGKEAVPELCDLLADERSDVRAAAAHALAGLGPEARPALPRLVEALHEKDEEVRDAAVMAIHKIGKDAGPFVLAALKDKDAKVRELSLFLLEEMPDDAKRALPALIEALSDVEVGVRRGAARCLGHLTDEPTAVIPALTKLFRKDQAVWVRRDACAALARFGTKAVPVLIAALGDDRRDVRRLAASYLGDMGYDAWEALPYLYMSKNDPERWVRSAAESAIEQIQTNNHGNGRR